MNKSYTILKTVIIFIVPYIILYSMYIQLNGESSPGGGFQAGVIFASGIIAYDIVNEKLGTKLFVSEKSLIICAVLGVLIYAACGLVALLFDSNYLSYDSLGNIYVYLNQANLNIESKNKALSSNILGQQTGIFLIELGVGLTVSSTMCMIYKYLREIDQKS